MFPHVSNELIDELNKRFPDKSPSLDENYQELMWRGGQRSIIKFLNTIHEDQLASSLGE
jgi:hypothetical protein